MTKTPTTGAARIGRRIGIGLFWFMALFVTGMSTRSVVGELYGSSQASPSQQLTCAIELRALEVELRNASAAEMQNPSDEKHVRAWLNHWDEQYVNVGECGELEDARQALGNLRARIAATLYQHLRHSTPLTERIERALKRIAPRSPSRAPKET